MSRVRAEKDKSAPDNSEALHVKYRPQSFNGVFGQDAVVKSFRALLDKRTNRTVLLSGPSGTGKTTLARIAAAELGAEPSSITEIDAATFTGIDAMRAITANLGYVPLAGEIKVLLIDECHALSKQAWQSLLKTLEEPPAHVWIFLCTTDPSKVPDTIKTRSAHYGLKPVDDELLVDLLEGIAKDEDYDLADGVISLCVAEASGSPRQAIVNLGVCSQAEDRKAAAALLKSAGDSVEAVALAKALLEGAPWPRVQPLLVALRSENQESVRQVVKGYLTGALLNTKKPDAAGRIMEMLDAFTAPFYDTGCAQLVIAAGHCCFEG